MSAIGIRRYVCMRVEQVNMNAEVRLGADAQVRCALQGRALVPGEAVRLERISKQFGIERDIWQAVRVAHVAQEVLRDLVALTFAKLANGVSKSKHADVRSQNNSKARARDWPA